MDTKVVVIDRKKFGLRVYAPGGMLASGGVSASGEELMPGRVPILDRQRAESAGMTDRPGLDGMGAGDPELDLLLTEAAAILRRGGLVAFPTETVYGLGANGLDDTAARKIYAAKGRPSDNPLILHISAEKELAPLVRQIPDAARKLMTAFWPGPLTMIFEKSGIVPYATTGGLDTVAVRMPCDPIAGRLIALAGVPVAAPSANRSGRPSPTTARHVIEDMDGRIEMILDGGPVGIGVESTIVDVTGPLPVLLRPGAVTMEMLREVVGEVAVDPAITGPVAGDVKPKAPGMKYRHYAPRAELVLVEEGRAAEKTEGTAENGKIVGSEAEAVKGVGVAAEKIEGTAEDGKAVGPETEAVKGVGAAAEKAEGTAGDGKAVGLEAEAAKGVGAAAEKAEVPAEDGKTVGSEAEAWKGAGDAVIETINRLTRERLAEGQSVGILCTDETMDRYPQGIVRSVGQRRREETIAHSLFAVLREFDELGVDIIYSESFASDHLGQAIMNRLTKAAGYHVIYTENPAAVR